MSNLGYIYYYGRTGDVDYEQAYKWFSKAAQFDDFVALYKVGDMYKSGKFVDKDIDAAFNSYQNALEGMQEYQKQVGIPHENIEEVLVRLADMIIDQNQDLDQAKEYLLSANKGFQRRSDMGDWTAKSGLRWSNQLLDALNESQLL